MNNQEMWFCGLYGVLCFIIGFILCYYWEKSKRKEKEKDNLDRFPEVRYK